ncbi:MAG TPA: nickel pincer cofactor biosynthesis protein LarC [Jiangellaceae bacterium]|nr:nickel pincer cofactor biosynthesis protein LarC [Jiangellaceae bacterium]
MIGWLDCSSGVAGDMVLGALVDAGVPIEVMQGAVGAVAPEPVRLRVEETSRAGLRALRVHVDGTESATARTWADIRVLLDTARISHPVRESATAVFERLAIAEGRVHGVAPAEVHFHEVGALDAIADIVAAAAGFALLGLEELEVSPVALGSGTVRTAHGTLPVPPPAVVELLRGAPTFGGGAGHELATPTGAALVTTFATGWGGQPPMTVQRQGTGAGGYDRPGRANVVRLLIGKPAENRTATLVLEANVDDMDPRLWPSILARLLAAGASDAWLVPIVMKKGRPAFTLGVLVDDDAAAPVRRVVFTETTTIGLRETSVDKRALDRTEHLVDVDGNQVRVKAARLDGVVVNVQPEYEDVVAVATRLGRPVKAVMADAAAAARTLSLDSGSAP